MTFNYINRILACSRKNRIAERNEKSNAVLFNITDNNLTQITKWKVNERKTRNAFRVAF